MKPWIHVGGVALLASAAAAGEAGDAGEILGRVRLSVKRVLDLGGERSLGHFTRADQVLVAISEANAVLARSAAGWRLELTEVISIPGAEAFFDVGSAEEFRLLDREARENPRRYLFREDAVNVYVVNSLPARGLSSFPGEGDIIAVNNVHGFPNGGAGWLHEIGHYLSLTHTYECYAGLGCDPRACTGEAAAHAGPRGRVRCPDTCPDEENVMSGGSPDPGAAILTRCQLEEMEHELRAPEGNRAAVLAPGDDRPRFRRGDADEDGALGLGDAIHILSHLFSSGPPPSCLDAADVNDDGAAGMTDAVHLLARLFAGGRPVAEPASDCGADATADALPCGGQASCSW